MGEKKEDLIRELRECKEKSADLEARIADCMNESTALKESEGWFRLLFEEMGDAAFIIETETGKILACNKQASCQTGYSREELIGMNILDDLSAGAPDIGLATLRDKVARGEGTCFVQHRRKKDGTLYWEEVIVVPLPTEKEKVYISLNRDITDRISQEKIIQQEREQLLTIFDSINAIIYVADPRTYEILYINKFFRDMLGKNPVGKLCYEEFQGRTEPCEFCTNPIILKNKGKPYQWEHHNPIFNRDYFLVDRIIPWPDGRDVRFEVALDITEQKQTAETLREREELYRTLFEKLSDALLLEDLNGAILDCNESACKLLGYSRKELTHMQVQDLLPEGVSAFKPNRIHAKTLKGKALETVNRRKDGSIVPVELRGRIIKLGGVPHMLVSLRDISERMRIQKVEKALHQITEAVNTSDDLHALFAKIRNILGKIMDTTNFRIALCDRETDTIIMPYMVDEKDTYRSFVGGNSLTAYVVRNDRSLLITEENREKVMKKLGVKPVGAQSKVWLGVPLRLEGRVVGAVVVQSYSDSNLYSEEDIAILETVSDQIAMAINKKQAQDALRESEARYRSIFASTIDAILVFNQDGFIVEANPAAYGMYGYSKEELIGLSAEKIVHPDYYHGFTNLKKGIEHEGFFAADSVNLRKDGTAFPVEVHGVQFLYGGKPHLLSITRDISARMAAEEKLKESQRKIERLHAVAQELEELEEEEDIYKAAVHAAEEILDFPLCTLDIVEGDTLVTKATSKELPPGASRSAPLSEETLATKTYRTGKTYIIGRPEEEPSAKPTRSDFKSGISAPIGNFGVFQVASTKENAFSKDDVRLLELLLGHTAQAIARIRLQKELKEQAIHDPLTGVYNRRYFNEVIEQELSRSKRYAHPIGFLMIDIDHFKEINDRFGHQMGDKVLQTVAELLQEQVRETDLVVRYGGDEFLVMLIETDGETDAVKRRIEEAVAAQNEKNEPIPFPVTISIGAAHWGPNETHSIEEILAQADRRMYKEKRR